jgi:hypothetical protein
MSCVSCKGVPQVTIPSSWRLQGWQNSDHSFIHCLFPPLHPPPHHRSVIHSVAVPRWWPLNESDPCWTRRREVHEENRAVERSYVETVVRREVSWGRVPCGARTVVTRFVAGPVVVVDQCAARTVRRIRTTTTDDLRSNFPIDRTS